MIIHQSILPIFLKAPDNKVTKLSEDSFNKLHDIHRQRMMQPKGSLYRMSKMCIQIPSSYSEEQVLGYHRDCYQKFTGNLNHFIPVESPLTSRAHKNKSNVGIIFPVERIVCDKKGRCIVKKKGAWETEPLAKFEFGGGETVLQAAESKNVYPLLKKTVWLITDDSKIAHQSDMEATHSSAFHKVCYDKSID